MLVDDTLFTKFGRNTIYVADSPMFLGNFLHPSTTPTHSRLVLILARDTGEIVWVWAKFQAQSPLHEQHAKYTYTFTLSEVSVNL